MFSAVLLLISQKQLSHGWMYITYELNLLPNLSHKRKAKEPLRSESDALELCYLFGFCLFIFSECCMHEFIQSR